MSEVTEGGKQIDTPEIGERPDRRRPERENIPRPRPGTAPRQSEKRGISDIERHWQREITKEVPLPEDPFDEC